MKKIIICSLIVLSLVGCGKKETPKQEKKVTNKFKKEYEQFNNKYLTVTIKEKNPMVYSNIEEIKNIMNNKSGLIYLGNPESNSCRESIEILIEAAKQTGLKKIYYLNTKDLNFDEEKYDIFKKYISDFNGIKLIFVKDKQNIGVIESSDTDYKPMTENEKDELLKIYRNSIHEMLGDLCDQSC